jgi:hypothetical protein
MSREAKAGLSVVPAQSQRLAPAIPRPAIPRVLRFEETPALRSIVQLSLGSLARPASEAGKWLYWWLMEAGAWPQGSFVRSCLRAAGTELRFIAEALVAGGEDPRICQLAYDNVARIGFCLGEDVPQATKGAFRETLLLHVTEPQAREAFADIGLHLWEWAASREQFAVLLRPAVAADLRILADYLLNLARLVAEAPLAAEDRHLAGLPAEVAEVAASLAAEPQVTLSGP